MKKALLFVAATVVSASAFASIGVTIRSDYVNQMKNEDAGIASSSTFQPSYARLTLGSKVGDADVVGNLDLTQSSSATGGFINHLFIKKSFADGWAMSVGKLVNPTGGFEAAAIDAGDDYNASWANGGVGAGGAALAGNTARLGNSSGVGLHWMSGSHAVEIQATNESNAATPNKSHNYGLAYTGGLSDSLTLKASYFAGFADVGTAPATTDSDTTYLGVGIRWAAAPFDVTFDYLSNKTTDNLVATNKDNKTNSMVLGFRYALEGWTPFAKVEMSDLKVGAADADKKTGLTLGAEVAPSADFRYHVAYIMNTFDPGLANAKNVNDSKLYAGIKWNADLLK